MSNMISTSYFLDGDREWEKEVEGGKKAERYRGRMSLRREGATVKHGAVVADKCFSGGAD